MVITAQVPLIVLVIANRMSIVVQPMMMLMAANRPIVARRKREVSMENYAHSTAQSYVQRDRYSVKEDSTKPAVGWQAHAEINNNIDGDLELKLNPKKNVQDLALIYAKLMKSYALHS
jgi:hypothetical protein